MVRKIISVLFILLLAFGAFLFLKSPMSSELASPLKGVSKLSLSNNLWFPKVGTVLGAENPPEVSAKSAFFVDTHTGEVLYEKDSHERLPIASLTKIMTVIVTMQNKKLSDTFTISQKAADTEPDKMELIAGEKLTTEELLDGVFTVSANDAAETFAEGVTGNRDEFISLMNKQSSSLGMKDTLFINPTGLEEDGKDQYSSAYDVALMSRFAIKNWPQLIDISSQPHIYLPVTSTHQDYDLYSGINLLTTYPGVVGFKTGYTPDAGYTLVTVARKGGREVLGVLLGSYDRRDEARELLDYSFKSLGVQ